MTFGASLRPRKMRQIELTVLSRDVDAVIEFLGRRALMHLSSEDNSPRDNVSETTSGRIRENLNKLALAATWLGVELPSEPLESSRFPGEAEEFQIETIVRAVSALTEKENKLGEEKRKVEETLSEARAFANLNAPFSDLDQLSYLTLRVGRLDSRRQEELRQNLSGRAVVIPLGSGDENTDDRILTAASRKGRFALDSELRKMDFVPINIPEGYTGIPSELLSGLEERLEKAVKQLEEIKERRERLRAEHEQSLRSLTASCLMAGIAEQLKSSLAATQNAYLLSGWVPEDMIRLLVNELSALTEGRIAVRSYSPYEIERVKEGREKVPVSLKHGAFVRGFEKLVFSYGAPLYGTVDPTPIVAFFFTLLFGLMFGDLGQGFVLFLLGVLTGRRGPALLSRFRKFSVPLVAVGISSMFMGLLTGSVFTNEAILEGPTRAVTGFLTGRPVNRVLILMPITEHGGSVAKLFYFFAFTISVGVLINSLGLIINVTNRFYLKDYERAFFAKTGLAGIFLFWYALFIAVRFIAAMVRQENSFSFRWFDTAGLVVPLFFIALGPVLWRVFSGKRPVFAEGFTVFFVEGFVEILETVSSYVSNTVSFLRVGVFALSHAVLSYIVFTFAGEVSTVPAASLLILVFGNLVIILLEGLIVAIQVVRLQYYEFFSKFFIETGVEFSPFSFRKRSEA